MRIEIICTGDEVLTGKIVNTNFSYMSQKLEDVGLAVQWETTVGDNREELLRAFQLAGQRADAVIVNGGLGPTVDDLSQEIAAQAAGVELVLHEGWLARMAEMFRRRSRVMPPNNRKQAMLPATAEMIDNPVGTACGFAIDIGKARFFFTPGVPRELRRMLEEQIIPRLLARSGTQTTIYLKRFHSYGLGESHVDALLKGVEDLVPDGSVKLGFRAHYPQLETKLTVRGTDMNDVRTKLAPVEHEVRKRLGNFILAEDDETLEGIIIDQLTNVRRPWQWSRRSPVARLRHASPRCPVPRRCFGVAPWRVAWPRFTERLVWKTRPPQVRSPRPWRRPSPLQRAARPALRMLWQCWWISTKGPTASTLVGRSVWLSRLRTRSPRVVAVLWAVASGCAWAPSRWGWTACAGIYRGCLCTSVSISKRPTISRSCLALTRQGGGEWSVAE